ncbi:Fc receptor-like A isoform X3 [Enhydra lutris kenyoni]|uniref:Fc receptor-like A isoform X3 n=1 Tax=Enhydra lutris kenyoni TaxID=391180 RepID=A0A2Y9JYC1_ENHLU|nr:Fc receptor-like A isoform X3 [Enhydra lutris kenyoni]
MLMKVSVLEAAEDLNRVTMKLGCVLTAGVLYFSPTVLWAVQMLLAAGFEMLQCEGPVRTQDSSCDSQEDFTAPREVDFQVKGYTFSKPFHLIVSYELFPVPLLRATPSAEPQEGDPVTLSCQTKLPLQRSTARLFYSFYKDNRIVRDRGLSPELQIPTASEAHSGSYWCEAATEDNQVWKQSSKLEIRVQGPSSLTAPPTLNPAPQKSAVPEPTPAGSPGPQPPLSTPSKDPGFSAPAQVPDPHLYHQMGILLKQMQDMRALLGHLVTELRNLSAFLKLETTKGSAKYE